MGAACGTYGGTGSAYRVLVGKQGKEPTWKTGRRWEANVKMRLLRSRIGRPGLDWSGSR
jgi:hypothetical protein